MNEPLIAALDRALKGDAQVLQGLGVEEAVITSPLWDDRLAFDGRGQVTFTSKRAPGDRGGGPIGVFGGKVTKDELKALLTALRQLAAAPPPPVRGEAYQTRVLLTVLAGGHEWALATTATPPALEPLQPVLAICGRAQAQAMEKPLRSLAVTLEVAGAISGAGPVPLVLHLHNAGDEGAWVSNPLRVSNQKEHERAELVYARPLVFTPGVTPVPVPPRRTFLVPRVPAAEDEPRYRWVPAKGEIAVPVQAVVEAGSAKELVLRAALFLDEGAEMVAGQPRLRGSVFSADVTVPVK